MKMRVKQVSELDKVKPNLSHKVEEIHFMTRPSKKVLESLASRFPNLSRVTIPPSLYNTLPKNLDVTIPIEPETRQRGRPRKYDDELINRIKALADSGQPVTRISRTLKIPKRTVYYHLKMKRNKESF